jgi:hypothetical protein
LNDDAAADDEAASAGADGLARGEPVWLRTRKAGDVSSSSDSGDDCTSRTLAETNMVVAGSAPAEMRLPQTFLERQKKKKEKRTTSFRASLRAKCHEENVKRRFSNIWLALVLASWSMVFAGARQWLR